MAYSVYIASKLKELNPIKFNNQTIIIYNHIAMPKGDFCLYKTMYLANIFYYLIHQEILMPKEDWKAWVNGPVNIKVRQKNEEDETKTLLRNQKLDKFLFQINDFFNNLDHDELFQIAHYDLAFKNANQNQEINIEDFKSYYQENFREVITYFKEKYDKSF